MKISFIVCNPDLSGGYRIIAEQARFLKNAGHHVNILGVITHQETLLSKTLNVAKSLIENHQFPSNPIVTDHFDNAGVSLTLLNRPNGPLPDDIPDADFIIATWWLTAEWVKDMPTSKGQKVYFIQGYEPFYPSVTQPKRVEATYELPYIQLAVCEWLSDQVGITRKDTTTPTPCHIVENGIHISKYNPPIRTKNKIPAIGTMYSTAEFKNSALSFAAIDILRKKYPTLKVLCFGSGTLSPSLPLPEGAQFHHRPSQDKIREIYSSCDAWLLSSDHEGFGLPMLEALACATPVVATIAGASPQLVNDETGSLCEERTPEAFAAHIEKILTLSDDQWQEKSKNARQKAISYDWKNVSSQFEKTLLSYYKDD